MVHYILITAETGCVITCCDGPGAFCIVGTAGPLKKRAGSLVFADCQREYDYEISR